ncbi:alpha/beta hydrolase [Streptomyces avermitilis]|uniref:alpha/beta hydrolase n=1 Tax=Streptomyces avermitilis TaxID=33903 RepID=UPI0033ACED6E
MSTSPIAGEHGFLLLHGWQNRRPAAHWQSWLAGRLTARGHEVTHPQLPDPDDPDLDTWLAELRTHLTASRPRTVVCHSLACVLWLHAAARGLVPAPVDRVLLVAPPSGSVLEGYAQVAAFARPPVTPAHLAAAAAYTRVVAADNDPYCPDGAAAVYAEPLGLPVDVLPGEAHLDLDAGYGSWPSLLDWCLDPSNSTSVTPR